MSNRFKHQLDYIKTAEPTIEEFKEDWDPIGPTLLNDMKKEGLIGIKENYIYLVKNES